MATKSPTAQRIAELTKRQTEIKTQFEQAQQQIKKVNEQIVALQNEYIKNEGALEELKKINV